MKKFKAMVRANSIAVVIINLWKQTRMPLFRSLKLKTSDEPESVSLIKFTFQNNY